MFGGSDGDQTHHTNLAKVRRPQGTCAPKSIVFYPTLSSNGLATKKETISILHFLETLHTKSSCLRLQILMQLRYHLFR